MVPDFKTQEEIYVSMRDNLQAAKPDITNWTSASVIRAILQIISGAIRVVYVVLERIYLNLFATDADRTALKREYDLWGLDWDDPETEEARKVILSKYQGKNVIGTKAWYENTALAQFPAAISSAVCYPNSRGPGTLDLYVLRHNSPIMDSEVQQIQDFFDAPENHPLGADIRVRTAEVTPT